MLTMFTFAASGRGSWKTAGSSSVFSLGCFRLSLPPLAREPARLQWVLASSGPLLGYWGPRSSSSHRKKIILPCSPHLDISASSACVLIIGEDGRCLPLLVMFLCSTKGRSVESLPLSNSCVKYFPRFNLRLWMNMKTVALALNALGFCIVGLASYWEEGEEAMAWHPRRPQQYALSFYSFKRKYCIVSKQLFIKKNYFTPVYKKIQPQISVFLKTQFLEIIETG